MGGEFAKKLAESSPWLAVVVLVVVAGGVLVWWIRKRFRDLDGSADENGDFLMQMRDLRRSGDVTEEEYRSIKRRLTSRLDGSSETKQPDL